ncbi:MAG: histidine kinase [Solirubrobacteraceae bacterium]|nr:histidine kinase [Solirubrobacteraceae bacterium]
MAETAQAARPTGSEATSPPAGGAADAQGRGTAPAGVEHAGRVSRLRAQAAVYVDDLRHGGVDDFDRSTTTRSARTWIWDILAIVATIGFATLTHVEVADEGREATRELMLIVDLVALPIVVILLCFRRQRPISVAALVAAVSFIAPGVGFGSFIAVYAAGAYGRPRAAKVVIGLMLVATPVVMLLWPITSSDSTMWSNLTFGVIVTLGVGAWGLYAGARRELLATLEERAVRAESEQALRIDQARASERTRIAREMHDVLAHRMSLLSVHAGALEFRPDAPPEEIARAAGVIRATAHDALEELRTVIGVMRVGDSLAGAGTGAGDDVVDGDGRPGAVGGGRAMAPEPPQPTLTAVPHLVEEWRGAGARIVLDLDLPHFETLPPAVGRTAYRLVQEALTNAGKHAPTAKVEVHVSGAPGESLVVSVTNPLGVGQPTSVIPGTGLGLVGLRERTELAGGVFAAGIDEDLRRFVLEARLPWPVA